MIYTYNISTPANTAESSPQKTVLRLERGIIHKVEIDFPSGSQHNLRLRIIEGVHAAFPRNASSDIRGDNTLLDFREHYPLSDFPFELSALTWNLDTTYAHVLVLRIGILPKSILTPWLLSWRERVAGKSLAS